MATRYARPSPPPVGAQGSRAQPSRRNVAVVSYSLHILTVTAAPASFVKAAVSKALRPFDLESGVRVTCGVGYVFANFGLPRPLCSRLRPDVRDRRQTDRR